MQAEVGVAVKFGLAGGGHDKLEHVILPGFHEGPPEGGHFRSDVGANHQGQVRFEDARLVRGRTALYHLPALYAPRAGRAKRAYQAPDGSYKDLHRDLERAARVLARRTGTREIVLVTLENGDVELVDIVDGVVKVRLKGAFAGCPMSQMTLRNGIERTLKQAIPEIKAVEPAE